MQLVRFGDWYFPGQARLTGNLTDMVNRTVRQPSMDGGFDLRGTLPGLKEIGNLTVTFPLIAASEGELQAKVDEVAGLVISGEKTLYTKPYGSASSDVYRWAWAKISNLTMSQNVEKMPHLRRQVQMSLQLADPHFNSYNATYSVPFWGQDEFYWGKSGVAWGGAAPVVVGSTAAGVTTTVTNAGNAYAYPVLDVELFTDQTAGSGVTITNTTTGDSITVGLAAMEDDTTFTVDCARQKITGTLIYSSITESGNLYSQIGAINAPYWLRLAPGANTITVAANGALMGLRVTFDDRWQTP